MAVCIMALQLCASKEMEFVTFGGRVFRHSPTIIAAFFFRGQSKRKEWKKQSAAILMNSTPGIVYSFTNTFSWFASVCEHKWQNEAYEVSIMGYYVNSSYCPGLTPTWWTRKKLMSFFCAIWRFFFFFFLFIRTLSRFRSAVSLIVLLPL